MTETQHPPITPMARVKVRLGDLGLARENARYAEPADEGIPQLAETLLAAGVVIPPIVRPGRKGELKFMALDGRRRRMGLLLLRDRGDIDDDYAFECLLAEDKADIARAVVLPNLERAPVHVADVIAAIGKLRRAKLGTGAIAAALGYAELDIRRLEALGAVHPKVLAALRQGRLTLKQVRLFARLGDKDRQAELAQTALDGYFQDHQLRAMVTQRRGDVQDDRLVLVGRDRYLAAGGRVSADLFGELPDALLDPEILQAQWRARIQPLVDHFNAAGLAVYTGAVSHGAAPDGFDPLPYVYPRDLTEAQATAWAEAKAGLVRVAGDLEGFDAAAEEAPAALIALVEAKRAVAAAPLTRSKVAAVLFAPDDGYGLSATFYGAPLPAEEWPEPAAAEGGDGERGEDEEDAGDESGQASSRFGMAKRDIEVPRGEVDTGGAGHALHEVRTDVATRGLMRDLADAPSAALVAVVAQLFKQLALHGAGSLDDSALAISATAYRRPAATAIASLDGEVRSRLEARRAAYRASGLRPIPWVAGLAEDERMALLAELAAIALDLREARTSQVRDAARAEAAEIAGLCGADIAAHWTPDAAYLGAHNKAQLLRLLAEMGQDGAAAANLKKAELVTLVAEAAADRRWAPSVLRWTSPAAEDPAAPSDAEAAEAGSEPTAVAA